MQINYNLTNTNYNAGRGASVQWIVIHNTANGTAREGTAYNNTEYFKDTYRKASAHYFVDNGDVVWCCVDPSDTAWHCGEAASRNGCYNSNSIGIEVCEPSWGEFTDKERETLAELVGWLMEEYGVDADHVCRHNDVTGKNCPWFYANDQSAWNELRDYITGGGDMATAGDVWTYNWISPEGRSTAPGGNMYNCACNTNTVVHDINTKMDKLATGNIDYNKLANAVAPLISAQIAKSVADELYARLKA